MAGSYDPVPTGVTQSFYEFATGHSSSGGPTDVSYSDSFKPTTDANQAAAVAANRARAAEKRSAATQAPQGPSQAERNRQNYAAGVAAKQQSVRMPLQKPAALGRPQSPVKKALPAPAPLIPAVAATATGYGYFGGFGGYGVSKVGAGRTPQPSRITGGTQYVQSGFDAYGNPYANVRVVGRAGDAQMPPGVRPSALDDLFGRMNNTWANATPVSVNQSRTNEALATYQSVLYNSSRATTDKSYATPAASEYKIKAGDTLSSIASRYGTTVSALKAANNIQDVNKIYKGDVLKIGPEIMGTVSNPESFANTKNSALDAIDAAAFGKNADVTSHPDWNSYYSDVKGAANYFSSGKHGKGDIKNTTSAKFTAKTSGKTFDLNVYPEAQQAFIGFLTELDASGYDIQNIGSQVVRNKRGSDNPSEHSYGTAIDINGEIIDGETAARNQYGKNLVTDLPPNVSEMAAKYGLSWGGDWNSVKDAMHFEYTGREPFKG